MAIYTPRGLKIRLPVPFAFALMSRLHPRVSAFEILKTTEGLEELPAALSFVAALVCAFVRSSPQQLFLSVLASCLVALLINQLGLYIFPGLVALGTTYSYFSGWGLLLILIAIATFLTVGWLGVVAFAAAKISGWLISQVLEWSFTRRTFAGLGHPLTFSERHFLNAYRLHAAKLGITTDISLKLEEEDEAHWRPALDRLASEWPQIVARFTR